MLENEDWWKANDWWKTKIGGKRIWESRRNDVSADEWSETKVVRKEQIWERIKSRRKDKCGSETKVVGKANVGANQKWSVKTNEADPKGQPHSVYVLRAK